MRTIAGKKSLVLFDQNKSSSNIHNICPGKSTRLLLKPYYVSLFRYVSEELKTKQYTSFIKLWHNACEDSCKQVRKALRSLILNDYEDAAEDIERVVMKFRGNAGEILAEAFFTANLCPIVDGSTYVPVDPTNERFIDAEAISSFTDLPVGIQVKNYNISHVGKETFDKAAAEDCYWLRVDKKIPEDKVTAYLSSPHQIIFSLTDTQDLFKESHADVVVFLGPSYIDSKGLQGSTKLKLPSRWKMFSKIADEIEEVK